MFKPVTSEGFDMPAPSARPAHNSGLPALIATLSLGLSIVVVLTAITLNAARAAQLF